MGFDYFYGLQADQYSFIRLPKLLMTQKEYAELSTEAKLLYGLLLDRMGESRKNKWLDDQGRVFIVYPIAEIQEIMGISKKKAMADLAELETHGLIVRKHRGNGRTDMIYVMNLTA